MHAVKVCFLLQLLLFGLLFSKDYLHKSGSAFYLKFGLNQTDLLSADDEIGRTERYGMAKNWRLSNFWILTAELNATTKKAYLGDVLIEPNGTEVYNHDISINVGYVEVPVMINYDMKIGNIAAVRPYIGYALQLQLGDNTKVISKEFICSKGSSFYPCGDMEYDFSFNPDYIPRPRLIGGLIAGGSIVFNVFSFEYRYTVDSPGFETIGDVEFNGENFFSTSIIFGVDVLNLIRQLGNKEK